MKSGRGCKIKLFKIIEMSYESSSSVFDETWL